MAIGVDPDQNAPSGAVWSGSALLACVILSEILVYQILGQLPHKIILLLLYQSRCRGCVKQSPKQNNAEANEYT